jgi:hypothetical protein
MLTGVEPPRESRGGLARACCSNMAPAGIGNPRPERLRGIKPAARPLRRQWNAKARRAKVKWVRRSVCSIALLLVCLDWKSDSLELSNPPPVRFQSCNTTAWSKEGGSYCASYVLSGISGWFSQFNASFHLFGIPNAVLRTKSSGKS